MNEFERKLRQIPFRPPPPELRDAIFANAGPQPLPASSEGWTWRNWFWPSPQAWAALAALWIIFAALTISDHFTSPPASPTEASVATPSSPTLLSYHTLPNPDHVFEFAN